MRLRQKISGTAERPRMSLYISNKHIEVQFVDDDAGKTIASATTRGKGDINLNIATATALGKEAAEIAVGKGMSYIVVDRGGFKYHGRVKALVEAALMNGLKVNDEPFVPAPPKVKAAKEEAAPAKPAKGEKADKSAKPAKKETK